MTTTYQSNTNFSWGHSKTVFNNIKFTILANSQLPHRTEPIKGGPHRLSPCLLCRWISVRANTMACHKGPTSCAFSGHIGHISKHVTLQVHLTSKVFPFLLFNLPRQVILLAVSVFKYFLSLGKSHLTAVAPGGFYSIHSLLLLPASL